MSDVNDILSTGGKDRFPEDKLMAYLEGKLPADEQREIELWLADEGMESDAMDGLQAMQPRETADSVNKLNLHLRKTLHNKKKRRRRPGSDQFTWIAIIIILLLAVAAYIVLRRSI